MVLQRLGIQHARHLGLLPDMDRSYLSEFNNLMSKLLSEAQSFLVPRSRLKRQRWRPFLTRLSTPAGIVKTGGS